MKSPAFQWYVDDFLGSGRVALMSLEEVGAYTILLNREWGEGGLPEDLAPFPKWLKVTPRKAATLWASIKANFELRDGRWFNPRLDKERQKQAAWREKSAKGGQKSAEVRWGNGDKGGYSVVAECLPPNGNTPSPSPKTTTDTGYAPEFESLIWRLYPKREGKNPKDKAYRAYRARIAEGVDFTVLQDGLARYDAYVKARGWVGTRFVMMASTFFGTDRSYLETWEVLPEPPRGVLPLDKATRDAEFFRRRGIIPA